MEIMAQTLATSSYIFLAAKALGFAVLVVSCSLIALGILGEVINFLGYVAIDIVEWATTSERDRQERQQRWQANAEEIGKEQEARWLAFMSDAYRRDH